MAVETAEERELIEKGMVKQKVMDRGQYSSSEHSFYR